MTTGSRTLQGAKTEPQSGAYPTFHYVACKACGQLTRIEVCYPTVQVATLNRAKYCPLCSAPFETLNGGNGSQFYLVALSVFNKEPTKDDVELVAGLYKLWDANTIPTFKEFIRTLINQAKPQQIGLAETAV